MSGGELHKAMADAVLKGRHVLMRFQDNPTDLEKQEIARLGITLLASVNRGAWFARVDNTVAADEAERLGMRWIGGLGARDKLSAKLREKDFAPWAIDKNGDVIVVVTFFDDIDEPTARSVMSSFSLADHGRLQCLNSYFTTVAPYDLERLCTRDEVQWVEQMPAPLGPNLNGVREAVRADEVHEAPYNLKGQGVRVLVEDGLRLVSELHVDLEGRVRHGEPAPPGPARGNHATMVAGIIAGTGSASNKLYEGIAPEVELVISYWYDGSWLYDTVGDLEEDYDSAYGLGVELANNSIGSNNCSKQHCELNGLYTVTSRLMDKISAGNWGPGSRVPLTCVFSAGNERDYPGVAYGSIGQPGTAKNVITVGATNSDTHGIADMSSWGPTHDGRIKPDVVAPGDEVGGDTGVTAPRYTTDGNDRVGYWTDAGTSLAAPVVSGCCALLIQAYRERVPNGVLLPSTLKAALINSATDRWNTGPDFRYGYGEIDVKNAVDQVSEKIVGESSVAEAGTFELAFPVSRSNGPLRASVAWLDPAAAAGAGIMLVNNLDITLVDPSGVTHYPYVLNPAVPDAEATRGVDSTNNAEQVGVTDPVPGWWTLRVHGTSVPVGPQSFSYAISVVPEPPLPVVKVVAPSGCESWASGSGHPIKWNATNTTDVDHFVLNYYDGYTPSAIALAVDDNVREYFWTLPAAACTGAKVEVIAIDIFGRESSAESEPFTIYDPITAWEPADGRPACTAVEMQGCHVSTPDGFGGTIVGWIDRRSGVDHVYAQRFDEAGSPKWTTNGVPVCVTQYSEQTDLRIAADGTGGAILAWSNIYGSSTVDVLAQRLDGNGNEMWTTGGVEVTTGVASVEWGWGMSGVNVISDGDRGAIVGWIDHRGSYTRVFAQRLRENGSLLWGQDAVYVSINWPIYRETRESVQMLGDGHGGAYFAWASLYNGDENIYMQRVRPNGALEWQYDSPGRSVCVATGTQWLPHMVSDSNGGAIITWYDERGTSTAIYSQRANSEGTMLWTTNGVAVAPSVQLNYPQHSWCAGVEVVSGGTDGWYYIWRSESAFDSGDIYAQRLGYDGATQWTSGPLALCDLTSDQGAPNAISDNSGGAVVVWHDRRCEALDIFGQSVNADGSVDWKPDGEPICTAMGNQSGPNITAGGVLYWTDDRNGNYDIYVQKISAGSLPQPPAIKQLSCKFVDVVTGQPLIQEGVSSCPAGDWQALRVEIEFDEATIPPGAVIRATSITLDKPEGGRTKFWYDGPITADSDATPGNQYKTTITHRYMSTKYTACDYCPDLSLPVRVDGVIIGYAAGFDVRSFDLTGAGGNSDGVINISDLTPFGDTFNKNRGQNGYDDCVNVNFDDNGVNLSDYAFFGAHYQHTKPGGFYSPAAGLEMEANASIVLLEGQAERGGEASVVVRLVAPDNVAAVAFGLQLDPDAYEYVEWIPSPEFPGVALAATVLNEGSDIVFISASGMATTEAELELGTLKLRVLGDKTGKLDPANVSAVFGEVLDDNGRVLKLRGLKIEEPVPAVCENLLADCHPNPFNPTTTIGYAIKERTHVSLNVYNVAGQLVRTLVDEEQAPSSMRHVVWDGRDNSGESVSSGIYFYRLTTKDFTQTKKMVLLK
jgi:hypothetical protein